MIYIGSLALNQALGSSQRKPKDYDFICSYNEFQEIWEEYKGCYTIKGCYPSNKGKKMILLAKGQKPVEAEIAWEGSTAEWFTRLVMEDKDTQSFETTDMGVYIEGGIHYPSLDALYMLKMSHRYLKNSPHFQKTRLDIKLMESKGAKIRPEWMEFYKARQAETYWYKHPKLNQTKDNFFDKSEGVVYVFEHDTVHNAVKHLDTPAYEKYKPPGNEVQCSKEMFFAVDEQVRLFGCLEECYVLSIERSQVPHPGIMTAKQSFDKALMKVCTSITSGYFREFAYNNYDKIQSLYDPSYLDRFWLAVESGVVKRL